MSTSAKVFSIEPGVMKSNRNKECPTTVFLDAFNEGCRRRVVVVAIASGRNGLGRSFPAMGECDDMEMP
jgi:hypothetical protein